MTASSWKIATSQVPPPKFFRLSPGREVRLRGAYLVTATDVVKDADGEVVRDALLWNDTRSAAAAEELVAEFGEGNRAAGARWWADAVGSVPVASYTVTKLRWLADDEPENAARVAAVALPHDWLTWKILGTGRLEDLVTDRSDASGTGFFNTRERVWADDLIALAGLDKASRQLAAELVKELGRVELFHLIDAGDTCRKRHGAHPVAAQIGRASCRERVSSPV